MSRIRSKNTIAEKIVFKYLRKENIYFQKHYGKVPGCPDIALPRKKKGVFIDGDFWHGRDYKRILNSRGPNDYWPKKIAGNVRRDKIQRSKLKDRGWDILEIWESDIKRKHTRSGELEKIKKFLTN